MTKVAKVIALNFQKKIIPANKNNFDEKFDTLEKFNNYLINIKNNDCLIFFGDSPDNLLYKNQGILYSLIKNLKVNKKLSALQVSYDGTFDLFNYYPLKNNFVDATVVNLESESDVLNTLSEIYSNRIINESFTKITKSHLLIKIFNDNKTIYILDLSVSQKKRILHGINNSHFSFLNKTIANLKKVIIEGNDLLLADCFLLEKFKSINPNFIFVGIIGEDRDLNSSIYNFIYDYKKPKLEIQTTSRHDLIDSVPFLKLSDNKENDIINYELIKKLSVLQPPKSSEIVPYKSNSSPMYNSFILPNINLMSPIVNPNNSPVLINNSQSLITDIKKFISEDDLKIKLEAMNKLIYREIIKNHSLMGEYKPNNVKELNEKIKVNLLCVCETILNDLSKY